MQKFLPLFFSMISCCILAAPTPIYQIGNSNNTFVQIPLTHDIYRYSQQADLQNLIVLDAEHNLLPYRLVTIVQSAPKAETKIISDSLAFFPVALDATPDTLRKLHSTQIKIKGDSVQLATSDKTLSNATPEFYLIDVSKLDHAITNLVIDWDVQKNNQYLEVELEATSNLQDWFSLGHSTLVQIHQEEQNLKRNYIDINIAKKEYEFLRLKILRGADNLHITQVTAEQKTGTLVEKQLYSETWSLNGELSKIQTSVYLPNSHSKTYAVAAWEFVRDETTPFATVALDLGNNTYGDSVKIFSRNTDNQNWQLQYQGIWFNAQIGSMWQKSDPIGLYYTGDKYWRVELDESAKNKMLPSLVFSWQPTQLQIITNNKPPYVLAIDPQNNNNLRNQIFNELVAKTKPSWSTATLISLNTKPDAILKAQIVDWKQWIFWAALILAVVVLLIFSLKLFKQMNTVIPEK